MIPSLSRGLRLALVLSLGAIGAAQPFQERAAYADDDDDDAEEDDGEDEDGESEDGEEEDATQPAVTAGGLYTLKTYPVRELFRPLTITQGITQIRTGVGVDVSAKGAFESVGINLEGEHGLYDHFSLLGGFTSAYNIKQFSIYGGFEGALAYDFIDIRLAAALTRPALPVDGATDGSVVAGDLNLGVDLGFPFRYTATPEIAIIALDTMMTIDFNSKPDLKPSLGISTNPIEPVSVVVFATMIIKDFDTTAGNFLIPATARVQFSPSQKLDLGAEFTFLNLKPPAPADGGTEKKFYDDRFLTLYAAFRL
jgi:hypothetical protein